MARIIHYNQEYLDAIAAILADNPNFLTDFLNSFSPMKPTSADIENRFTYHAPGESQRVAYTEIRGDAKFFARKLLELCPDSRELSTALTKLEEVVFWANAAIARNS